MNDTARQPLLEVRGLTRDFVRPTLFGGGAPSVRAVDGVSFSVGAGEIFGIVGESGCGKSTLARLVLRLIEPSAGEVLLEGRPITGLGGEALRRERRRMQMIFQDPFASLNPRMTVGEHLEEPLRLFGLAQGDARRRQVEALLRRVGLDPAHAERFPHAFSGGQRQRIGIARALASGPKLVVADEAVSALDVSVQAQILNLLLQLRRELALTLVFIAHDLAVVRHIADRIAVMYQGRVVEQAPTEALFAAPRHPYTQALLAAAPGACPGAHDRERRSRPTLSGDGAAGGCRFRGRCPHAAAPCATTDPALEPVDAEHGVACLRWRALPPIRPPKHAAAEPSPHLRRLQARFRGDAQPAAVG